ncbi:MAG: OmpA family protein [Spirochaetes bacterium]|nr:OmpA family protein [Spirochaetota bacterium]
MRKLLFSIFHVFLLSSLYSEVFKFQYIPKSKQRIEATITGEQLQNSKLILKYVQKYKTIRMIKDVNNDIANIEDKRYFYNYNTFVTNKVREIKNDSITNYYKDIQGKITVHENAIFPTLRNAPVFPEEDIQPNYQWTAPATEVQDLFNDKTLSIFTISVKYTFIGYEKINGKNLAKFFYEHKVDITNNTNNNIDQRIKRVMGESKTVMYFDNKKGTRVKEEYNRHYAFLLQDGIQSYVAEFIDSGERIWHEIESMDKDKIVEDLKEQLDEEEIEDIRVEKDAKGIKISLENLHFNPDSSELLPAETNRLQKIAKILKKYIDKGIMIIGHTTDKGTEKGRLKLSVERAKVIVNFLIDLDAINVVKSSFGGKGGTEPIADNKTEEGMKRNRRAEIYILEE